MLNTSYQRRIRSTVIHSLPGRVRIRCDQLKGSDKDKLLKDIKKIAFIKNANINTITGTALLFYDGNEANLNIVEDCFNNLTCCASR